MVEVGREELEQEAVVEELIRRGGSPWDPVDYLKTEADFQYYLEAAALEDIGDDSLISAALNDIARALNLRLRIEPAFHDADSH